MILLLYYRILETVLLVYVFIININFFLIRYIYMDPKQFTSERFLQNEVSCRRNCITPHSCFNDLSNPLKEQIRPSEETSDKIFISLRTFVVIQANLPRNSHGRANLRVGKLFNNLVEETSKGYRFLTFLSIYISYHFLDIIS